MGSSTSSGIGSSVGSSAGASVGVSVDRCALNFLAAAPPQRPVEDYSYPKQIIPNAA